jgi:hypothetical protein
LALKLFKGEMTSDGLPEDELAACLAAGQHPVLTTPVARLAGHPAQAQGLLMPLIPAAHVNLAGPPSLQSCTRDVYAPDFRLSAALALRIACDVAGAVAHLHQRSVMHGDLYAHNILLGQDGHALLGDFGAACFKPADAAQSLALEKIEVRAFGYLLEELLERCEGEATTSATVATLTHLGALRDACLHKDSTQRPVFTEVVAAMQAA